MSSSSSLGPALVGAVQASLSVLLTISYGVAASQFKLVGSDAARQVSKACVKIFLPALLMTKLGSELDAETLPRYLPILLWAIAYNVLSIGLGRLLERLLPRMPTWTTAALAFNNTTSMPLLLVQALEKTGILSSILIPGGGDSAKDAVDRAKTYFLINTMVSNSITFALGPKLLSADAEDAPAAGAKTTEDAHDQSASESRSQGGDDDDDHDNESAHERTSLLPTPVLQRGRRVSGKLRSHIDAMYKSLPNWAQVCIGCVTSFANAPVIGAAAGVVIGVTPPLKRAFFADPFQGGFLSAWVTSSLENVGDLFAALQVIVVGVKLAEALRKVKRGDGDDDDDDDESAVPWRAATIILSVRFLIWPAVGVSAIWALAKHTDTLGSDPILAFCMMLMPAGPPALKLMALAEVNDSTEGQKLAVAKFLSFAYAASPLIALSVVASLKATENVASL